jgi:hypothetical protein
VCSFGSVEKPNFFVCVLGCFLDLGLASVAG